MTTNNETSLLNAAEPEISVVIPCLDEADTLGTCLDKLRTVAERDDVALEVIVADNGSRDASPEITRERGARLVPVERKGYGAALMGGIDAARAPYVLMGDADDSYDFLELPKFLDALRQGCDLAQGCRLPGGGGTVLPGAMPWSHRFIGNPMFTHFVRRWFGSPIHDVYCGLRGFTKKHYDRLGMRCAGMEFATEMIIKSARIHAKTTEVPITLHPDGRISHKPHLRTVRDGLRTLRFFLLCNPKRLFLFPGLALLALGVLGYALAYPGATIGSITLGAHTLLAASLALVTGYQGILFHATARTFAKTQGFAPLDSHSTSPENSFLAPRKAFPTAGALMLTGVAFWIAALFQWQASGFSSLDYASTMRLVIPGSTLVSLAVETTLFSLFRSWLEIERKDP